MSLFCLIKSGKAPLENGKLVFRNNGFIFAEKFRTRCGGTQTSPKSIFERPEDLGAINF